MGLMDVCELRVRDCWVGAPVRRVRGMRRRATSSHRAWGDVCRVIGRRGPRFWLEESDTPSFRYQEMRCQPSVHGPTGAG